MRYIGRWISSLKDTEYPPPHELVGEYDSTLKPKIVNYLDTGHVLHVYRGYASCLFRCNYSEPFTEKTDGNWIWPSDLAHYVQAHNVLLPAEFIADAVTSTGHRMFDEEWRSQYGDLGYWRNWCNEHASGNLKNVIASALEVANRHAELELNAQIERLEKEHGLSNIECNWAGCTNTALSGRVFCSRCCLKGNEGVYLSRHFNVRSAING